MFYICSLLLGALISASCISSTNHTTPLLARPLAEQTSLQISRVPKTLTEAEVQVYMNEIQKYHCRTCNNKSSCTQAYQGHSSELDVEEGDDQRPSDAPCLFEFNDKKEASCIGNYVRLDIQKQACEQIFYQLSVNYW